MGPPSTRQSLRTFGSAALLFAAYFASAKLGLRLATVQANATAVWAPTGIALAAFLLGGARLWPAVFLGAFLANLTTAGTWATSLLIAGGNTLEGLLGAALTARFAGGLQAFEKSRNVFKFTFLAGFLSTAVSATCGVTSLSAFGFSPWPSYGIVWLTWWLGDMGGALLAAPFLLLWAGRPEVRWRRLPEFLLTLLVLVLVGQMVFGVFSFPGHLDRPMSFLCLPPLLWTAFRFSRQETSIALLVLAAVAVRGTQLGAGPFSRLTPHESFLMLQFFLAVASVTCFAISAALSERRTAQEGFERIRKAEQALLDSEKHFRALIENAQDIVTLLDERGTILFESPSLLQVLGYLPSELAGVDVFSFIHPDDAGGARERFQALLADPARPQSARFRFRHKDGGWRELESVGKNMLGEPAVQAVVVNSRDVTDREAALLAALESEERFRQLAEATQEGVVVAVQGNIRNANPAFARMFGYGLEEVIGRDAMDFVDPACRDLALRQSSSDHGETYEILGLRKDASTFPLEATGKTVPYHGRSARITTLLDVTEHKRLIQTIRENEERFRLMVDNIRDYAIFLLDPEGLVVTWNEGAQRIQGYTAGEIVGTNFSLFYTPEDAAAGRPGRLLKTAERQGRVEDQGWRVRKDGSRFWADVVITALKDEAGGLRGFAKVSRDITERRRLEELQRSNTELQQFANVASHDLQEPLRMVSNYVQLLAERYRGRLDQDADEFIGFAVEGARRMHSLINGLLEYARVESRGRPFQDVDFGELFDEALLDLKVKIGETGARIGHGPLPRVKGDALQLGQVLHNLFGNALKFRGPQSPEIFLSAEERGKEWVFACRDNGIGIDPKYHDRIFVIFQRLHARSEYEGTGIGLSLCKRIVERHGGRIWVESAPGTGSTFLFTLPERG